MHYLWRLVSSLPRAVRFSCFLAVFWVLSVFPLAASSITIGAPGDPNNGDCAPFGCTVEYQQVYGAGSFSGLGSITITDITFFNNNFVPGSIAPADYTISLSTTTAAVDGLDTTFANNLGADNSVFFSGPLGGLIGPTNQFTITGTPFFYDPANGNLLVSITSDGDGLEFSAFLDFLDSAPAGTFSRISSFDTSGVADTVQDDTGLVTEFGYSSRTSAVPEPGTATMLIAGVFVAFFWRFIRGCFLGCVRMNRKNLLLAGVALFTPSLFAQGALDNGDNRTGVIMAQTDSWTFNVNAQQAFIVSAWNTSAPGDRTFSLWFMRQTEASGIAISTITFCALMPARRKPVLTRPKSADGIRQPTRSTIRSPGLSPIPASSCHRGTREVPW